MKYRHAALWCIGLSIPSFCLIPVLLELVGLPELLDGFEGFVVGGVLFTCGGVLMAIKPDLPFYLRTHLCRGCGYDLRGIDSEVCPECGAEREPKA